MKKLLLTAGIFFLLIFSIQAQENDDFIKNKTIFGVKGGLIFNNFHDNHNKDINNYSFYGGFFSETRLSKKWSFQNELIYSNSEGYDFIEVPLLLKYHINEKWSAFAGPSLDFLVDNTEINTETIPLGLSAVIGTQYNFSEKFFIEGRINLGMTKQIDYSLNDQFASFSRNTFRVGIGYRF